MHKPSSETEVGAFFRFKEEIQVAFSERATEKLEAEKTGREISPNPIMNACVAELSPDASVKAAEQFQDLELIRRSQAGDTEAFGQLVTKYHSKIFTMVYGVVRNDHDTWDLAQEVFLKAWWSIHRFEGRSSFHTWLYRLTMNVTIGSLRRKGRRDEVELDDAIPSSLPGPGADCQRTEIRERVTAAISKLSPDHRAVIVLKELDHLQYHEIAEVLNLSVGTVMSRLFYARKKLQSLLRLAYSEI